MPTDSDTFFRVQATLTLPGTASVSEQLRACFGFVAKNDIGDQLFESWVGLHFAARPIAGVSGVQKHGKVSFNVGRKSLEMAQVMKELGGYHEHLFCINR
jgi:hypothetical protein